MQANSATAWPHESLKGKCLAEVSSLNVSEVMKRPNRMEAGFYASEGYRASQAMEHSGFDLQTLGHLADILWFGPFARKYVADVQHGLPFLTSSTMLEAQPTPSKLVSRRHTKGLDRLTIHEGCILVSCSGTIGNVVVCTKDVEGWACSQDAMRVVVRDEHDLGPVYCYLQSPIGQFMLRRSQSGSVVTHIYENDAAILSVPHLPCRLREELTRLVRTAGSLRVEANRLLDEADRETRRQLELPYITRFEGDGSKSEAPNRTVFSIRYSERLGPDHLFGERRLDTTYHSPLAVNLQKLILSMKSGTRLGLILKEVRNSNIRKRVYLEGTTGGVPLGTGKHLVQLRPTDVNRVSATQTRNIDAERVREGWVLVSCGGTVGRVGLVHRNFENWVMSQDVMRLVVDERCTYPGFVYSFLSSAYGQLQLQQSSYGSVLKKLRDLQFKSIAVCVPKDNGLSIHEMVVKAHDARADAVKIEDSAFGLFMSAIGRGRDATEAEWGKDY